MYPFKAFKRCHLVPDVTRIILRRNPRRLCFNFFMLALEIGVVAASSLRSRAIKFAEKWKQIGLLCNHTEAPVGWCFKMNQIWFTARSERALKVD